ncbi:MbnP family protein [Marixanthomonas ophiurae]|uniref:Copper-binding protein MbnP-like domain-containing protein n=1 Tax=Marixanthomonas ophiurae TaxID=387659 RepID=A0A3E1QA60_9FLAO|nr:MbnP family protein [Marixanthomonas ophiurae]RFN59020.1 hypothetical protein DZ858_02775 [Marixanthomonas ophiurae]
MKKNVLLLFAIALSFFACKDVDEEEVVNPNRNVTFNFTQNWEGEEITNPDYQTTEYTNANDEVLTISKLRYLISDVTFTDEEGDSTVIKGYNLVNAREGTNLQYKPSKKIPEGTYDLSFTFGFDKEDNIDGTYEDLTAASWGVPEQLGGGYHFMQMEGTFIDSNDSQAPYLYHTIRAADMTDEGLLLEDTSFEVSLGTVTVKEDASFEIKMDVSEWYKNPNRWDLNVLNTNLMMNFEAQKMMSENGKTVFSLGEETTVEE